MSLLARFNSAKLGNGSVSVAVDGLGTVATIAPPPPVRPAQPVNRVSGIVVKPSDRVEIVEPQEQPQRVEARPVVESVETIEKLRPIDDVNSSGNRIRAAQIKDSAAEFGFSSVNKAWYHKTLTYDQAREVVAQDRGDCLDLIAPRRRFSPIVGNDGCFALEDRESGAVYRPTENALGQLAAWCDTGLTLPKRLIDGDEQDREILRLVMENGWRKLEDDKPLMLRLKSDGSLRAVLSDQYARVDNQWFLDVLESIVPGGRVSHFRGDGDAIFFNLLIPDTIREDSDGSYGAMLASGNSEIGTRKIATLPSVFRWICFNGNIWDQVEGVAYVRRVHRGEIDLDTLAAEIRENLNRQIPLLPQGIDKLLGLRSIECKGLDDIAAVGTVLQQMGSAGITRPMAARVLEGFRDQRTTGAGVVSAFDLVNGITKAAQEFAPSVQESVERAAGELTAVWDRGRWESAFSAARSFGERQAKSVFPLGVA